jgi:hypothetical protein
MASTSYMTSIPEKWFEFIAAKSGIPKKMLSGLSASEQELF